MKVLNIGKVEMDVIDEALKCLEGTYERIVENEKDSEDMGVYENRKLQISNTIKAMCDMRLQELVERVFGMIWEEYLEFGYFPDEFFDLAEDMGIEEDELVDMFIEMGYEKEDCDED